MVFEAGADITYQSVHDHDKQIGTKGAALPYARALWAPFRLLAREFNKESWGAIKGLDNVNVLGGQAKASPCVEQGKMRDFVKGFF